MAKLRHEPCLVSANPKGTPTARKRWINVSDCQSNDRTIQEGGQLAISPVPFAATRPAQFARAL
jgi:hypothetical protein